jgi:hypothetical protein
MSTPTADAPNAATMPNLIKMERMIRSGGSGRPWLHRSPSRYDASDAAVARSYPSMLLDGSHLRPRGMANGMFTPLAVFARNRGRGKENPELFLFRLLTQTPISCSTSRYRWLTLTICPKITEARGVSRLHRFRGTNSNLTTDQREAQRTSQY